jgi:hypothetical protein
LTQRSVNARLPAIATGFEMRNHFRRQPDARPHLGYIGFGSTAWRKQRLRSFRAEKLGEYFTGGSCIGKSSDVWTELQVPEGRVLYLLVVFDLPDVGPAQSYHPIKEKVWAFSLCIK